MSDLLPGGEVVHQIPFELDFEGGKELLSAMAAGGEEAAEALAKVALDENGNYSVERGKLASVIFVPRPDFRLVREVRHWPSGPATSAHSDEPINTRLIYPPSKTRGSWRLASKITPSPDRRYQIYDFDPATLLAQGHTFAIGEWQPPKL